MDVGVQLIFSAFGWSGVSDREVWEQEVTLGLLAEELGFDAVWPVEHHYFDYAFCPDNVQFLTYLAGRTSRIALGTGAVILPWNEPLRVAERIAVLDLLSNGRVRFGMGRGLSRREYAPFRGIEMDSSRQRFDESAAMIIRALESGFIEGDGPFYPQVRTPIRPRPERSFADRLYAVANSSDSIASAAALGARIVMFAEREWGQRLPSIERHRDLFQRAHGTQPPPMLTADFTICDADAESAARRAREHLGTYLTSLVEHYELLGDHFGSTEGYGGYAKNAAALRLAGEEKFLKGFMAANAFGTPDQILKSLEARRGEIGAFELSTCFRYGGMPFEEAQRSMRLFAREVLPVLHSWQ